MHSATSFLCETLDEITGQRIVKMVIHNKIRISAIILLVQTVIWLVFTILSMSQVQSNWSNLDYISWVSSPDFYFIGNYINATLLTVSAITLLTLLNSFLKQYFETSSFIGYIFVPMYGILNIICYSIQISIVPSIAFASLSDNTLIPIASQLIQANKISLIGYLNGLAYAILGIPSIIFGILLFLKSIRLSGILLASNGLFCIIGIIGYILNNSILSTGTMIGGILFLLSLIFMIIDFRTSIKAQ